MKHLAKYRCICLLFILTLMVSACHSNTSQGELAKESMVEVSGLFDGHPIRKGIGFLLGADGHILTPFSSIDGCNSVQVTFYDGREVTINALQKYSSDDDMAMLRMEAEDTPSFGIQLSEQLLKDGAYLVRFLPDGTTSQERLTKGLNLTQSENGWVIDTSGESGLVLNAKGQLLGFVGSQDTDAPASIIPTTELVTDEEPISFETFLSSRPEGTYYAPDGVYVGELHNGLPDGQGVYTFNNGDVYEGAHKYGVPDGQGTYIRADGGYYEGDMREGLYDGEGVYEFPDGSRYEGAFRAGMRSGEGAQFSSDGDLVREGTWQNDKPIMPYEELFTLSATHEGKLLRPDNIVDISVGTIIKLSTEYPESLIGKIVWYIDTDTSAVHLPAGQSQTSVVVPFSLMPGSTHTLYAQLESTDGQRTNWIEFLFNVK